MNLPIIIKKDMIFWPREFFVTLKCNDDKDSDEIIKEMKTGNT